MKLPVPLISANRATYYLLLSLAICLPLTISAYLSKTQVKTIELSDYRSYQCATGNNESQERSIFLIQYCARPATLKNI